MLNASCIYSFIMGTIDTVLALKADRGHYSSIVIVVIEESLLTVSNIL